jgi:hypothetical protein
MKKENKSSNKIIFILLFFFIILVGVIFFSYSARPLDVKHINIVFIVEDSIGISASSSELDYGIIPPGLSSTKKITIHNPFDFEMIAKISVEKDLKEFIFGDWEVVVLPNESLEYPVRLQVPYDAEFGNYSGLLRIEFYKE